MAEDKNQYPKGSRQNPNRVEGSSSVGGNAANQRAGGTRIDQPTEGSEDQS